MKANLDRVTEIIRQEESFSDHVYISKVNNNKPHIGYGRNLQDTGLSDEELNYLDIEDEDDLDTRNITKDEAEYLLKNDVNAAINGAYDFIGDDEFETLTAERQEVLIHMAYMLGSYGLSKWRKLKAAILAKNWEEAGNQILNSHAARHQAPERYAILASVMISSNISHFGDEWAEVDETADKVDGNLSESDVDEPTFEDIVIKSLANLELKVGDLQSQLGRVLKESKAPEEKIKEKIGQKSPMNF